MIARATKIADDSKAEILAEAKAQAEKATSQARDEITAEKERAIAELLHVAELALEAAGRLVKSEMDGPTQRRLVEDFLSEVTPAGAKGAAAAWRAAGPPLAATRRPRSRSAVPTARSTRWERDLATVSELLATRRCGASCTTRSSPTRPRTGSRGWPPGSVRRRGTGAAP